LVVFPMADITINRLSVTSETMLYMFLIPSAERTDAPPNLYTCILVVDWLI